ncbi:hypothetical protein C8J57DRAFT_1228733 [Mycena rebaudengoi]|nr:hypothetical protein C8J57DRAFT_1228733 [Mycena rebaudengoi]
MSRPDVEEFLALLTDLPHLGLMITMRGAERPSKVKWTRPFLASLDPLSGPAALQIFIDVADDNYEEDTVRELLELTGNMPRAQDLLGILSILPDGLTDSDLVQTGLQIPDILACKSTLLRTPLSFKDENHRIKVLAPIREHTINTHPPRDALKLKLRQYFHEALNLWKQFRDLNSAQISPQISRHLSNINYVFLDALSIDSSDAVQNGGLYL